MIIIYLQIYPKSYATKKSDNYYETKSLLYLFFLHLKLILKNNFFNLIEAVKKYIKIKSGGYKKKYAVDRVAKVQKF